jgi:hypothetical protein
MNQEIEGNKKIYSIVKLHGQKRNQSVSGKQSALVDIADLHGVTGLL